MRYLIANWKMNMAFTDIDAWCDVFERNYHPKNDLRVIICPSYPYLPIINSFAKKLENVHCGAQDFSIKPKGAHTGQTGIFQIADFAGYCILGHSETKNSVEDTQIKAQMCPEYKIQPIICHKTYEEAFDAINAIHVFEDPSNISHNGQSENINMAKVKEEILRMRRKLQTKEIIYGGSVNRQNAQDLVQIAGADGFLVGNASLNPTDFLALMDTL